jgi:hypothetical protein
MFQYSYLTLYVFHIDVMFLRKKLSKFQNAHMAGIQN